MAASDVIAGSAALAAMALALLGLRRCWARGPERGAHLTLASWALLGAAAWIAGRQWGGALGTAYALLAFSLLAYGIIAVGAQRRAARADAPRRAALDPQERRAGWGRGAAKAFLAIVLSGITAIGLGLACAVGAPLDPHDRIMIGGLLVPVLWGAGMAWTLCDANLRRAALVLSCLSVLGYAVAFLPKLMA